MNDKLYELSVGNMDLAVRIFREAQRYIIGCGDERITGELLEHAASIAIKASRRSPMKSGENAQLLR
nr:hypothetical protein [Escherichia coli]